ncbi:MAG: glycoside hydrolase family 25 protein [Pelolinea sp.]|nr:glycoside hydrolase family 25 protein [Pelolinea sp.]
MIPGIDVSHWQREIDWGEVKRSGVKFAFIKATEFPDKRTSLFVDEEMRKNIDGASSNGIYWSAYHFFRTHIDPVIQAKVFCETVGDFTSLPPVLDLEVAGSKGERLNYKVRQFLDETERITNRRPIVYSSGGFWRSYMTYEKKEHTDWARAYPLWVAQYTTLWPTPLYPWAGWEFWQYTDKGKIPGVITHVDLNWFNGSVEDLERKFVIGDNAYPNKIESIGNYDQEENGVVKKISVEQTQSIFRGDFQEPYSQRRPTQVQEEDSFHNIRKSAQNFGTKQKEDDWIRTYFLQKTV